MGVFSQHPVIGFWVSSPHYFLSLLYFLSFLIFLNATNPISKPSNHAFPSLSPPPLPPPPPPPPPPLLPEDSNGSTLRPSIAVIVAVLTTMFSMTFLLLLYAKHCKRGGATGAGGYWTSAQPVPARKNSGIDRAVIEFLPIFRFGSLSGQKGGLECAVCLNRFEPTEVLRLLPKCRHAFHVECVDTWLDAHSTCPLCRYRVDPEDVLLPIASTTGHHRNQDHQQQQQQNDHVVLEIPHGEPNQIGVRRVSGRHSSAGEGGGGGGGFFHFLQPKRQSSSNTGADATASFRRSLDSAGSARKKGESVVTVGCFDRSSRKDGLLLTSATSAAAGQSTSDQRERTTEERKRLEHRIIVSSGPISDHERWSDVHPSDLLYLRSEMLLTSDSRRLSLLTEGGGEREGGKSVINGRSVSEITGMSRFHSKEDINRCNGGNPRLQRKEKETGMLSRWTAWISQNPAVRSGSAHHAGTSGTSTTETDHTPVGP